MPTSTADAKKALATLTKVLSERDQVTADMAAAVTALQTQVHEITAQRNALQGERDTLLQIQSDLALHQHALDKTNRELQAQVGELQAQVTDLQLRLEAALHPVEEPPVEEPAKKITFLIGCSVPDERLGEMPIRRTFSSGGIGTPPKEKATVHSFKRINEAEIREYLRNAPYGQAVGFYHEPEDNVAAGGLKVEDWVRGTLTLNRLIKESGRGDITQHCTFMGYSLNPASGKVEILEALLNGQVVKALQDVNGVITFDQYGGKNAADGFDGDVEKMFGKCADYAKSKGVGWAISETGFRQDKNTDGKRHAADWQRVFDFLGSGQVEPPRWFIAWNRLPLDNDTEAAGISFAIQDLPEVVEVWKKAVQQYLPA